MSNSGWYQAWIGLECHESTAKGTFNTPCQLLGDYQERKLGVFYTSWGIYPWGGCRKLPALGLGLLITVLGMNLKRTGFNVVSRAECDILLNCATLIDA